MLFHCSHFERNEISFQLVQCYVNTTLKQNHAKTSICACQYKGNILFNLLLWNSNCNQTCLMPKKRNILKGGYIRKENTSICNLLNLLCFLFLLYKARISAFCTPCKTWNINMFKVNNKETRIRKVNDKVKNKDTVDVVLASLLLTLNTFHFLLHCFYCWLWSVNCPAGFVFYCSDAFSHFYVPLLTISFSLWRN